MTTLNRKRLALMLWSVWLLIVAIIQSNVAAVSCGLISEFRLPATFIYDGRNQTTVAYDSSGESAIGYDVGAVLTRHENRDKMTGDCASFVKIAELPAAEVEVDKSWKLKISGSAHETGPGHRFRTYREAIGEAKNPDVVSVHLDHGYNRALGLEPGTIQPNRRPDVISIYRDASVKRVEVQSSTDAPAILRSRNTGLDQQIIDQGFTPTPPVVVRPH
jgi:hypothetical protein